MTLTDPLLNTMELYPHTIFVNIFIILSMNYLLHILLKEMRGVDQL